MEEEEEEEEEELMLSTRAPGSHRIPRRVREDTRSSNKVDGLNLQRRAESTERTMERQP